MIKLEGLFYGERIKIECEYPHICVAVQAKLWDVFDRTSRQGCPKKCPYIIGDSSGPPDHIKYICDVITKGDEEGIH